MIYFLYTGTYPETHIAHLKVNDFITLSDDCVVANRVELVHAHMYSMGTKYGVPELASAASRAFRSLGHSEFCSRPGWPSLANYIYTSTGKTHRDLRHIVLREVQFATSRERSRFKMADLKHALELTPELAADLASNPLTWRGLKCSECNAAQAVLVLPCSHEEEHASTDEKCFELGVAEQECYNCHETNVLVRGEETE